MNQCKFCGARTKNRVFCGKSCGGKFATTDKVRRQQFYTESRNMKVGLAAKQRLKDHPEYVSRFVKENSGENHPMKHRAYREKMKATLIAIGHKPKVRGGNGTGMTAAESALMTLVELESPQWNYAVRTMAGIGFPKHYKLDVAIPGLKLAIEADGSSHQAIARKLQDTKKTNLLQELGWTVLRFTNKRILETPETVRSELMSIISKLKAIQAIA